MVGLGDLAKPAPILAALGFALIVALEALKVRGAVLIGILAVTIISIVMGFSPVRRRDIDAAFAGTDLPAAGHHRRTGHRPGQRDFLLSCLSTCSITPAP